MLLFVFVAVAAFHLFIFTPQLEISNIYRTLDLDNLINIWISFYLSLVVECWFYYYIFWELKKLDRTSLGIKSPALQKGAAPHPFEIFRARILIHSGVAEIEGARHACYRMRAIDWVRIEPKSRAMQSIEWSVSTKYIYFDVHCNFLYLPCQCLHLHNRVWFPAIRTNYHTHIKI